MVLSSGTQIHRTLMLWLSIYRISPFEWSLSGTTFPWPVGGIWQTLASYRNIFSNQIDCPRPLKTIGVSVPLPTIRVPLIAFTTLICLLTPLEVRRWSVLHATCKHWPTVQFLTVVCRPVARHGYTKDRRKRCYFVWKSTIIERETTTNVEKQYELY